MERKINNGIFYVVISLVAVLGIGSALYAYTSQGKVDVHDGGTVNYYEAPAPAPEVTLGAFPGTDFVVDNVEYGESASVALKFTAGAPTTTGSFGNLFNYGPTKICDLAEMSFTASGEKVAYSGMVVSLSTSTAPTTFSSGASGSLIASTTRSTSSPVLLNSIRNVGRVGTGSFIWATGEYVIPAASFNDTTASSTDYSKDVGKVYMRCHVR